MKSTCFAYHTAMINLFSFFKGSVYVVTDIVNALHSVELKH